MQLDLECEQGGEHGARAAHLMLRPERKTRFSACHRTRRGQDKEPGRQKKKPTKQNDTTHSSTNMTKQKSHLTRHN